MGRLERKIDTDRIALIKSRNAPIGEITEALRRGRKLSWIAKGQKGKPPRTRGRKKNV